MVWSIGESNDKRDTLSVLRTDFADTVRQDDGAKRLLA